jgi:hypothetical protein
VLEWCKYECDTDASVRELRRTLVLSQENLEASGHLVAITYRMALEIRGFDTEARMSRVSYSRPGAGDIESHSLLPPSFEAIPAPNGQCQK